MPDTSIDIFKGLGLDPPRPEEVKDRLSQEPVTLRDLFVERVPTISTPPGAFEGAVAAVKNIPAQAGRIVNAGGLWAANVAIAARDFNAAAYQSMTQDLDNALATAMQQPDGPIMQAAGSDKTSQFLANKYANALREGKDFAKGPSMLEGARDFFADNAAYWEDVLDVKREEIASAFPELLGSFTDVMPLNPLDPVSRGWWTYNLITAGVDMAVPMGLGLLAGPAGLAATNTKRAATLGAFVFGGGSEAASTYEKVLERTGDTKQASKAGAAMGTAVGLLNALGARIGLESTGIFPSRFAKAGLGEAVTESLEEPYDVLLSGDDDSIKDVVTRMVNVMPVSFVLGGFLGGAFGNNGDTKQLKLNKTDKLIANLTSQAVKTGDMAMLEKATQQLAANLEKGTSPDATTQLKKVLADRIVAQSSTFAEQLNARMEPTGKSAEESAQAFVAGEVLPKIEEVTGVTQKTGKTQEEIERTFIDNPVQAAYLETKALVNNAKEAAKDIVSTLNRIHRVGKVRNEQLITNKDTTRRQEVLTQDIQRAQIMARELALVEDELENRDEPGFIPGEKQGILFTRLSDIIKQVANREITPEEAAEELGISENQLRLPMEEGDLTSRVNQVLGKEGQPQSLKGKDTKTQLRQSILDAVSGPMATSFALDARQAGRSEAVDIRGEVSASIEKILSIAENEQEQSELQKLIDEALVTSRQAGTPAQQELLGSSPVTREVEEVQEQEEPQQEVVPKEQESFLNKKGEVKQKFAKNNEGRKAAVLEAAKATPPSDKMAAAKMEHRSKTNEVVALKEYLEEDIVETLDMSDIDAQIAALEEAITTSVKKQVVQDVEQLEQEPQGNLTGLNEQGQQVFNILREKSKVSDEKLVKRIKSMTTEEQQKVIEQSEIDQLVSEQAADIVEETQEGFREEDIRELLDMRADMENMYFNPDYMNEFYEDNEIDPEC